MKRIIKEKMLGKYSAYLKNEEKAKQLSESTYVT